MRGRGGGVEEGAGGRVRFEGEIVEDRGEANGVCVMI